MSYFMVCREPKHGRVHRFTTEWGGEIVCELLNSEHVALTCTGTVSLRNFALARELVLESALRMAL